MSQWREQFPWTGSLLDFLWPEGPARRKRWLRIAVGVLVVLAAHLILTAIVAAGANRAVERFVARWGKLDPALHRPAPVEDSANRARAVRAATDIMVLPFSKGSVDASLHEGFASDPKRTFTESERVAIRKVVADNVRALSLLDVAVERPEANWDLHYERGIEVELPPLLAILRLAKLNAAAGRLAVEEGRIDDALTAVRRGSAIASSLANEPILIVQLIRLAVDRLDAGIAKRILESTALRADHVDALQSMNPPRDPRRDLQRAMVVETKAMSAIFRSSADTSEMFSSRSQPGNALALGIVRAVTRPYLLREGRLWIEIMSARIDTMNEPRYAREKKRNEPVLRKWDVMVSVVLQNLESVWERCDLAESRDRIMETAIGVERQRIGSGKAPATIAALDPLTGRGFAYETDGARWRIRSEADVSSMESAKIADPLLDWSHKE